MLLSRKGLFDYCNQTKLEAIKACVSVLNSVNMKSKQDLSTDVTNSGDNATNKSGKTTHRGGNVTRRSSNVTYKSGNVTRKSSYVTRRSSNFTSKGSRITDKSGIGSKSSEESSTTPVSLAENSTQTLNDADKQSMLKMHKVIVGATKKGRLKRKKIMDWKQYHRLRDIYDFIDELERDYPSICSVSVIGQSVEGRDIKMMKISNSNAKNSPVWLDGSIHPREWISSAVVTYIINMLVKNYHTLSSSLTNKDWHIVPVLNPDGYEYSHTCNRMWRKNRAKYGGTVGVDLNRNFSYGWGHNGEEGSSEDPDNIFYRGPAPFSEPESAAVRDTIMSSRTPFKVFLSFHSYFELIIFPWGYKKDPCPHYLNLLEAGTTMARSIFDSTGVIYKVGSTKDLTYYACGTSIDWSYAVAKIPYSFMIELRSKKYKFRLPRNQIHDTCVENWRALQSLMDYVDQHDIQIMNDNRAQTKQFL